MPGIHPVVREACSPYYPEDHGRHAAHTTLRTMVGILPGWYGGVVPPAMLPGVLWWVYSLPTMPATLYPWVYLSS